MSRHLFLLAATVIAAGCSAGPAGPDSTMDRLLLVELHPDGNNELRTVMLPRKAAQQRAGVIESAITVDNPCASFYDVGQPFLGVYSGPNYTNSAFGTNICFHGSGTADLSNYCFWDLGGGSCGEYWSDFGSASWYNSANGGVAYSGHFTCGSNTHNFSGTGGQTTSSSPCPAHVDHVTIN